MIVFVNGGEGAWTYLRLNNVLNYNRMFSYAHGFLFVLLLTIIIYTFQIVLTLCDVTDKSFGPQSCLKQENIIDLKRQKYLKMEYYTI